MRVEEEYQGVLQNIEIAIVMVYEDWPDMSDHAVARVVESLIDAYNGEIIGRQCGEYDLSEDEKRLMAHIWMMCEFRLGRSTKSDDPHAPTIPDAEGVPDPDPITLDEMVICLKRILKSVRKWNKVGGRQGYLNFIAQYVR